MAGDNKLTFDPPTRLPELTQNLIRSSHCHSTPSLKISCKSVQPFSRNLADKETNKETKKEGNRAKTIPRPPYRGRGNNLTFTYTEFAHMHVKAILFLLEKCHNFAPSPPPHCGVFVASTPLYTQVHVTSRSITLFLLGI